MENENKFSELIEELRFQIPMRGGNYIRIIVEPCVIIQKDMDEIRHSFNDIVDIIDKIFCK